MMVIVRRMALISCSDEVESASMFHLNWGPVRLQMKGKKLND